jgi:hypothetical protein
MDDGRLSYHTQASGIALLNSQGTASSSTLKKAKKPIAQAVRYALQYGTGSGQVNLICAQQRTLAASANEELNLFSGALTGVFGEATGFAKLKYLAVWLIANPGTAVTASSITVGAASATQLILWFGNVNDTHTVFKNGPPYQGGDPVTGVTVDNTAKLVKVLNNDGVNAATYVIVAAGLKN